jgi:nucleoside-diphosphate-sugar epimerase
MNKVLITGATGYIGSYVTKVLAAMHPELTILALSRSDSKKAAEKAPSLARFKNV